MRCPAHLGLGFVGVRWRMSSAGVFGTYPTVRFTGSQCFFIPLGAGGAPFMSAALIGSFGIEAIVASN